MTHSPFRWRRLLIITVLLIAAAGAAAAPMRDSWLPLVARPLGLWSDARVPLVSSQAFHAVSTPAGRVAVDGLVAKAPERADFIAVPLAQEAVQQSTQPDRTSDWAASTNSSAPRNFRNSRAVNGTRFDNGPRGFAPPAHMNASPNGGRDARTSRTASNDDARSSTSFGSRSSFTSPRRDRGRYVRDDKRGSDDLFTEHRGGLRELTGKGKGHKDKGGSSGGRAGRSNLASQPEPSTLLLLGTGLAAAAGAIRRRLRQ